MKKFFISLGIIVLAILLVIVAQLIMVYMGILPKNPADYFPKHIFLLLIPQAISFTASAWLILRITNHKSFPWFKNIRIRDFFIAFAGWVIVLLLASLTVKLSGIEVHQFEQFKKENLRSNIALLTFSIVILAPVYEEYIFRGAILGVLINRENMSKRHMAFGALISGIFFTLIHLDLDAAIPIFFLGIYLSILTLWKKSIHLSVFVHILQNISGLIGLVSDLPDKWKV